MTLPTGTISFSDFNTELGNAANSPISLNDSRLRGIVGVSSGTLTMDQFRGKSYFSVSGGTTSVSGGGTGRASSATGSANVGVVTAAATVGTVVGGTTPYTYAWEYVSGETAAALSASSASTAFQRYRIVVADNTDTYVGVYRCKITDAAGRIIYGPNVTITTNHTCVWIGD